MEAAVRRLMAQGRYERIAWFGHSGGGALAVFLAARFRATAAVVTIAGNLDTDAWADHHGYERLAGSLNPARQPALPRHILQLHYAGGGDKVVPPHVTQRGVNGDRAKLILVEDFDHVCCWEEAWPEILTEVTRYLADAARPD